MIRQNSTSTKAHNRAALVTLLLRKPMSRAELAKQTGLTRAAVGLIADGLISEGFLCEQKNSGGSRYSVCLSASEKTYLFAGVDISRADCVIGLCTLTGKILSRNVVDWKKCATPQQAIETIARMLRQMQEDLGPALKLLGIGITIPGPVNARTGYVLQPLDMDFWFGFPIVAEAGKYFDCPIWVENNSVARAIAEDYYGCGRRYSSFVELTVFHGIGCGIVSGHRIFYTENGVSNGIGHSTVNNCGERCKCGNIGCLEMYALPERIAAACKSRNATSWQSIVENAARDAECMQAVFREAAYLVSALIILINLFSPQAIVLSGELNTASSLLLDSMHQQLMSRLNRNGTDVPEVVYSAIPDDARLLAACSLGIEKFFWEKP